MKSVLTHIGRMLVVMVWPAWLCAQEGLGPMGAVGSDTQQRALAPVQAPSSRKTEAVAKVPAPAVPDVGKQASGPAWTISDIKIIGDHEFAIRVGVKEDLEGALVGTEPRTQEEIREALRKVYSRFINEGYYLARVSLPSSPYNAEAKTLTVLVEEGLFGNLRISYVDDREDGRWFSRKQIEKKFKDLVPGETFNYKLLYDDLAKINAHPDLTLDTKITVRKPIEERDGEKRVVRYADLDIKVKESMPLHAVLDIDNFGIEAIDEWQAALTLQYLNLTQADDVLTISPAMALDSSMYSLAGSYMRPHDIWRGGATTLYGGWSDLDVDDVVPQIDLEGMGWFVGLVHSQTLLENDDHLVSFSAGILYRYIEDQFSAFRTSLQQRDVAVLPLSVALSYSARRADAFRGRNFATLQGVYNLAAMGDNDLEDMWVDADDHYWIGRAQVARLQPLFGRLDDMQRHVNQWILFLKAEGQYASCPLIPAEKLALGGHNTVRGYQTKGYLGDNGIYGTIELRTPILLDLVSNTLGRKSTSSPLDRLQFVAFTDFGFIEFNDPLPGVEDSETLMSVGAGARIAVTQHSQLRFDVGVPVANAYGDDDSVEYYLNLQLQF